jgi:uncharacterized protein YndB with AHSA1/START domain
MVTQGKSALKVQIISDTEIELTRTFDAPREYVFEAWTSCEHVSQWWGRRGSTLSVCEMDFRVGGAWRFVELGADGEEAPFRGEYKTIDRPNSFSYTFIYDVAPFDEHPSLETITLTESNGKTLLTNRVVFDSKESRDAMLQSGMEGGANETMDRLEEYLGAMGDREVVIERVFDAPRELVFDAWTSPEAIAQWFGPNGITTTTSAMDFRAGGTWRFVMRDSNGTEYQNIVKYIEIKRPERLVYDHGSPEEPDMFRVFATFAAQGKGTKLTMRSVFRRAAAYEAALGYGAIEGGQQTLARLAEYLAHR